MKKLQAAKAQGFGSYALAALFLLSGISSLYYFLNGRGGKK